ncbi:MAG: LamG domain-containing protein [Candidatus Sumerlaeota bacterium]|nr:LamG domain-containing protein [Candidatus Sumerlaeota bacterium]
MRIFQSLFSHACIQAFFSICLAILFFEASAALTPEDDTTLTLSLEALSDGWIQPSVDTANAILSRSQYSAEDWTAWFDKYFNTTDHPFTDDLMSYLGYPVFGWFDDTVHLKLQIGLVGAIWTKATVIVAANKDQLGMVLLHDSRIRQSAFNSHLFFARVSQYGIVEVDTRNTIYQRYKAHISAYPQFFSDAATIDVYNQPLIATLRAQVWASFGDTLPLTESRKAEIAQTIALNGRSGKKRAIWDRHGVLVIDNNQLDDIQLDTNAMLLDAISPGLRNLRFMTVRYFLQPNYEGAPILLKGQTGNLINYYFWLGEDRAWLSFDGAPGSWIGVNSGQAVTWDAWNHIAGTYDGSTMRIFLNGAETGTLAAAGAPVTTSREPLRIGFMPDFNFWMRGTLDDVKIFSRPLMPQEIASEYNLQPISTSSLVCHWKMDESTGTLVANASGLGHHGVNTGAVPVPGRINNGLFFNGYNSTVAVDDRNDLRLDGSLTVEAWVYMANEWPIVYCGSSGMVNTFECKVGAALENSFPDDIAPRIVDIFCIGNNHEFNHIVDAYTVWRNPALNAREKQLIAQAGAVPLQYLRSMCVKSDGTSVFPDAPQEFFASLSNEYFTDSWHTLDLALARFAREYKEPINQFLFFADIYSQGGGVTKVYTIDSVGHITTNSAQIGRDAQGRINRLTRGSRTYHFALDDSGNVTSWTLAANSPAWRLY